jgi:hypothetical protein
VAGVRERPPCSRRTSANAFANVRTKYANVRERSRTFTNVRRGLGERLGGTGVRAANVTRSPRSPTFAGVRGVRAANAGVRGVRDVIFYFWTFADSFAAKVHWRTLKFVRERSRQWTFAGL